MFNEIAFASGARMPLINAKAAINNAVFFMMFILDTLNPDKGELFSIAILASEIQPRRNLLRSRGPIEPLGCKMLRRPANQAKTGTSSGGMSTHFPCSRMRSCSRSTASPSGILNFTGVLPT